MGLDEEFGNTNKALLISFYVNMNWKKLTYVAQ